jgi:ribonuclease HI
MDSEAVITYLLAYSRKHANKKGQLAAAAAQYMKLRHEFVPYYDIFDDPLLREIVDESRLEIACGWKPSECGPVQKIYCDGCCLGNGREDARAGYGVYLTDSSGAELSSSYFRVPTEEAQTNQRAELHALRYALAYCYENSSTTFEIYSDSKYAIDCLQKWSFQWEASGWRRSDNKPVLHSDLIKDCLLYFRHPNTKVKLYHVESHTGRDDPHSRGNAMADRLARAGAELIC